MSFVDCRKIVKSGDNLKIRWIDAIGLTITCDVYDPFMNKTTYTMVENPAGSGIYELLYTFDAGNGDYLFVVNSFGLQVSCISELSNIDAKISEVKLNTDLIPNIKANTDVIQLIKYKTDKLQFDNSSKVLASIDDSKLAKYDVQKRTNVEIGRLAVRQRRIK